MAVGLQEEAPVLLRSVPPHPSLQQSSEKRWVCGTVLPSSSSHARPPGLSCRLNQINNTAVGHALVLPARRDLTDFLKNVLTCHVCLGKGLPQGHTCPAAPAEHAGGTPSAWSPSVTETHRAWHLPV